MPLPFPSPTLKPSQFWMAVGGAAAGAGAGGGAGADVQYTSRAKGVSRLCVEWVCAWWCLVHHIPDLGGSNITALRTGCGCAAAAVGGNDMYVR